MELTSLERDMPAGKHGEGTALAMKVQVGTGKAFYAKRMAPITRAHVDSAFYDDVEDGDHLRVDAVAGKLVLRTRSAANGRGDA